MAINTHFYRTMLNMEKVRQLLPVNHRITRPTGRTGCQKLGDYFVFSVGDVAVVNMRSKYVSNLTMYEVREDGTTTSEALSGWMTGPVCEKLKDIMVVEEEGNYWRARQDRQRGQVVWIVLHRLLIKDRIIYVEPESTPFCEIWLLVSKLASTASASLVLDPTPPPPSSPSTSNPSFKKNPSIQVSAHEHCKPSTSSSQPSPTVHLQPQAQAASVTSSQTLQSPVQGSFHYAYEIKKMSEMKNDSKVSIAAVVVEVLKLEEVASNDTMFDILRVADRSLDVDSNKNASKIKIFHNNKNRWLEDGKPERGRVIVLKNMKCVRFNNVLEGVVYNMGMVCICTRDEDNKLTWHSHSHRSPNNIRNAEKVAMELFDWWRERGSDVFKLPCQPGLYLSTFNISQAGGFGLFKLSCKVVKKQSYPPSVGVLTVSDGTCTSHQFEEFPYDPTGEVHDSQRILGAVGSKTVDILMNFNTITPTFENAQVGMVVHLTNVECMLSRVNGRDGRRLTLRVENIAIEDSNQWSAAQESREEEMITSVQDSEEITGAIRRSHERWPSSEVKRRRTEFE